MNIRDYIWDLGGTLLDNYEMSTVAFVETLEAYGCVADHDAVYQALKVSTDHALAFFAADFPDFFGLIGRKRRRNWPSPCSFQELR